MLARAHQPKRDEAAKRRVRQARYRKRQREGLAVAPTPYNDVVVSALVRWRFLDPDEVHTPQQIGEAMFAVVEQAAALGELNELLKYLRGQH